jgi:hypothetical protein
VASLLPVDAAGVVAWLAAPPSVTNDCASTDAAHVFSWDLRTSANYRND